MTVEIVNGYDPMNIMDPIEALAWIELLMSIGGLRGLRMCILSILEMKLMIPV